VFITAGKIRVRHPTDPRIIQTAKRFSGESGYGMATDKLKAEMARKKTNVRTRRRRSNRSTARLICLLSFSSTRNVALYFRLETYPISLFFSLAYTRFGRSPTTQQHDATAATPSPVEVAACVRAAAGIARASLYRLRARRLLEPFRTPLLLRRLLPRVPYPR